VAGVSNVYLSQIEAGLEEPSAEIMQKIAKALSLSAETLYIHAGILDEERQGSTESAILSDSRLSDAQRQALLTVLRSFLADEAESDPTEAPRDEPGSDTGLDGYRLVRHIAILSYHTSPLAQPGTGDGGA
jgi:transcriptional regulator with XRE-family HTH domain